MVRKLIAFAGLLSGVLSLLVVSASAFGNVVDVPILVLMTYADDNGDHLYLYDLNRTRIASIMPSNDTSEFDAQFAPDRTTLVFSLMNGSYRDPLTALTQLDDRMQITGEFVPLVRESFLIGSLAWSPLLYGETAQLAFVSEEDPSIEPRLWLQEDIWLVDVPLSRWQGLDFYREGSQDIFPAVGDTIRTTRRRLTNDGYRERELAWSPNGQQMAFISNRGGTPDIYVLDVDGTEKNIRRITHSPAQENSVSWSPDGQWLAFSAPEGLYSSDIFVVSINGGEPHNITVGHRTQDYKPVWLPGGETILYMRDGVITAISIDGQQQYSLMWVNDFSLMP